MKKPIVAVLAGFLLVFNASLSLGQNATPRCPNGMANFAGYGCLYALVTMQEQDSCKKTGGSILDAVGSTRSTMRKTIVACMCPKETAYHLPSKTCVKIGTGSIQQTNQPAKRVN
jgi:hypothetical protein